MTPPPNILITSGTYVSAEIAAEFGRIPPAFLPIGNRRLYERQVQEIRRALPHAPIFMSLPSDFDMDAHDRDALAALEVMVVPAAPGLSLGASLTYVALSAHLTEHSLLILHGDTLLQDYPFDRADAVSVGVTRTYYPWADYVEDGGRLTFPEHGASKVERNVLTGAFHLADTPLFLRALVQTENRFVAALGRYSEERRLGCVAEGRWLDFGHLHTYFQSRRQVTTERHFNRLQADDYFFVKSSINRSKIDAERRWFETVPESLRVFLPEIAPHPDQGDAAAYRIEYCYLATLTDLFVFGRLPPSVWRSIFDACSVFLTVAAPARPERPAFDSRAFYRDKTLSRLRNFAASRGLHLEAEWRLGGRPLPSLLRIVEQTAELVGPAPDELVAVTHGDFCFSNILFDFRTQRIKVIDPRGLDADGRPSIYGDVRYETAKLHHSVVGLYDHIVAGRYAIAQPRPYSLELSLPESERIAAVQSLFGETVFGGRSLSTLKAAEISVLLFLSMLPLHADDPQRQTALLANALRLYAALEEAGG